MTRKEKIQKLKSTKLCVIDMTLTCDLGLEFTVLTADGVTTNIGNILSWPCTKLKVNEDLRELQTKLKNGVAVSDDDLLSYGELKSICTYNDPINGNYVISGDELTKCMKQIRDGLTKIDMSNNSIYAYAYIEAWEKEIKFFDTEEGIVEFFKDSWGNADCSYDDMDDKELDHIYIEAEESGWNKLPMFMYGFTDGEDS